MNQYRKASIEEYLFGRKFKKMISRIDPFEKKKVVQGAEGIGSSNRRIEPRVESNTVVIAVSFLKRIVRIGYITSPFTR